MAKLFLDQENKSNPVSKKKKHDSKDASSRPCSPPGNLKADSDAARMGTARKNCTVGLHRLFLVLLIALGRWTKDAGKKKKCRHWIKCTAEEQRFFLPRCVRGLFPLHHGRGAILGWRGGGGSVGFPPPPLLPSTNGQCNERWTLLVL